ncbi:hypothetical protein [Longimicrobium sp.]|nr:hypothetical protein [Longimicrobium sp.]
MAATRSLRSSLSVFTRPSALRRRKTVGIIPGSQPSVPAQPWP